MLETISVLCKKKKTRSFFATREITPKRPGKIFCKRKVLYIKRLLKKERGKMYFYVMEFFLEAIFIWYFVILFKEIGRAHV